MVCKFVDMSGLIPPLYVEVAYQARKVSSVVMYMFVRVVNICYIYHFSIGF